MGILDEMLAFNKEFVKNEEYKKYEATKFPNKRAVILSCMDTRLTKLLPSALNLKNGDAKFVKNAGAVVTHPFGSIMRSIIIAVYELSADEVFIIGHRGCGMDSINPTGIVDKMKDRGIHQETITTLGYSGIDLHKWLHGFDNVHDSVRKNVEIVKNHPLLPHNVPVHGLVIDPETGELELVVNGYEQ
jgi:carbonic anhydrase